MQRAKTLKKMRKSTDITDIRLLNLTKMGNSKEKWVHSLKSSSPLSEDEMDDRIDEF